MRSTVSDPFVLYGASLHARGWPAGQLAKRFIERLQNISSQYLIAMHLTLDLMRSCSAHSQNLSSVI